MKNEILNADCFDIFPKIQSQSIDLILCDPPYGMTQNDWDKPIPPEKLWPEYKRIIKPNGAIVIFSRGIYTAEIMLSNKEMWRYNLIWHKPNATGHMNANKMPLRSYETISVFYRKLPTYNPQKTTGHPPVHSFTKHTDDGNNYGKTKVGRTGGGSTERYPTDIITFSSDKQKRKNHIHETQKPVALIEWLIKTYTNEGDIILDNCAGSFTTAVACDNLKRDWICIEKEKSFCDAAHERINLNRENLGLPLINQIIN